MALFGYSGKSGAQRLEEKLAEARKAHGTLPGLFRNAPAPVQKAAGGLSPSGNVPTILSPGSAVQARKAAEDAAGRVVVQKRAVVMRLSTLDTSLSADAVVALDYVVRVWQQAGRQPVKVLSADLAKATKLREPAARAALAELRGTGHLIDVRDGFGVERIAPTSKVTQGLED